MKNQNTKDERKWCVYCHINKINGKKYYGKTSKDPLERWKNGHGYKKQTYFYNAIIKYGWDNFEHIILHNNLSCSEASDLEKYYIEKDKTNVCRWSKEVCGGYNMTDGGEGKLGHKHTQESKEKISQHSLEMWKDPNKRKELIEKRSGQNSSSYGKKMSDETKQKLSNALKGMFAGEKNYFYNNHNFSGINSVNSIPIYCKELNEIFFNSKEANRLYGIDTRHIGSCCNGKRHCTGRHPITNEPLHWLYVYDKIQKDGAVIKGAISLGYITEQQFNNYINEIKNKERN